MIPAIKWNNGILLLLDQRLLPEQIEYVECNDYKQAAKAIKDMVVRGAPAIGIAGGYGVAMAVEEAVRQFGSGPGGTSTLAKIEEFLGQAGTWLASARPTAVNLPWAVHRVLSKTISSLKVGGITKALEVARSEARALELEDIEINHKIGFNGSALIKPGSRVLTHCNAGALATGGWGTALGVVRQAWSEGKISMVYADETRPFLQGARLTAWELKQDGIDVTVLVDSAAGYLIWQGNVDAVIVGADRIAANGDTANKIGTYTLACLCRQHCIPFYVAAPVSTFDLNLKCGSEIPVEQRAESEVLEFMGRPVAAKGARAFNPSFDVTPGHMISAIITERGVISPLSEENIKRAMPGLNP